MSGFLAPLRDTDKRFFLYETERNKPGSGVEDSEVLKRAILMLLVTPWETQGGAHDEKHQRHLDAKPGRVLREDLDRFVGTLRRPKTLNICDPITRGRQAMQDSYYGRSSRWLLGVALN